MKEFMTLSEFEEYFNVSLDTVRKWEQIGLKARYITAKTKVFYKEDIRKFILKEDYEEGGKI
ncbi:MAG: hypothetical protein Q4A42_03160 [Tissierellia bacterium]|nr:hypothetical protein [Tissierellia bacterium]